MVYNGTSYQNGFDLSINWLIILLLEEPKSSVETFDRREKKARMKDYSLSNWSVMFSRFSDTANWRLRTGSDWPWTVWWVCWNCQWVLLSPWTASSNAAENYAASRLPMPMWPMRSPSPRSPMPRHRKQLRQPKQKQKHGSSSTTSTHFECRALGILFHPNLIGPIELFCLLLVSQPFSMNFEVVRRPSVKAGFCCCIRVRYDDVCWYELYVFFRSSRSSDRSWDMWSKCLGTLRSQLIIPKHTVGTRQVITLSQFISYFIRN